MENIDIYWDKQYKLYKQVEGEKCKKYKIWQPARWAANMSAVKLISNYIDSIDSSMELGAGSLAFSLMLNEYYRNKVICIDKSKVACKYGKFIAHDMNVGIEYINKDFFNVKGKNLVDIVLSLGVIEHYNREKQVEFLKLCKELTKRYVFVAIPNQESEIFEQYVDWTNENNQLYEENHESLNIDELENMLKKLDMHILLKDGFQMFLSDNCFWKNELLNKYGYMNLLRQQLNPKMTNEVFKNYKFSINDIQLMSDIELSMDSEYRKNNAFMNFILAEKIDC